MRGTYEKVSIIEFGAHLLRTGDLDPVYIALDKMTLDFSSMGKWLTAYWCFYHCGVASFMSGQTDETFWDHMMVAAVNEKETPVGGRWPRGHERRHFRGQQGIDAIASLRDRYPSGGGGLLARLMSSDDKPAPFRDVAELVQQERGFGPWISFKVCDMLERLDLRPIDFDQAGIFMFKDPREAAIRLFKMGAGLPENSVLKDESLAISRVVKHLESEFMAMEDLRTAPPRHERALGLQEIETILCKWKSMMNGHYKPQNDTIEIREGLSQWSAVSKSAELMLSCMPQVAEFSKIGRWS